VRSSYGLAGKQSNYAIDIINVTLRGSAIILPRERFSQQGRENKTGVERNRSRLFVFLYATRNRRFEILDEVESCNETTSDRLIVIRIFVNNKNNLKVKRGTLRDYCLEKLKMRENAMYEKIVKAE